MRAVSLLSSVHNLYSLRLKAMILEEGKGGVGGCFCFAGGGGGGVQE